MSWRLFSSSLSLIILAALLAITTGYFSTYSRVKTITKSKDPSASIQSLDNVTSDWNAWHLVDSTAQGAAWLRYIGTKETDPLIRINHIEPIILKYLLPLHLTLLADLHFSREWIRKNFITGAYEAVLARTHYIDNVLSNALNLTSSSDDIPKIHQLVILGAGYDTRAFRFYSLLAQHKIKVFEVDLPQLQEHKRNLLKQAAARGDFLQRKGDLESALENIAFVPVNFEKNHDSDSGLKEMWSKLKDEGYDEKKRTLFIWEGVTAYLTPAAVASTFHSLHHHSPPASLIVFDFLALSPKCLNSSAFQQMAAVAESKNEPFRFIVQIPSTQEEEEEKEENVVEKMDENVETQNEKNSESLENSEALESKESKNLPRMQTVKSETADEILVSEETDAGESEENLKLREDSAPAISYRSKSHGRTVESINNQSLLPLRANDQEKVETNYSSVLPVFTPFPSPIEEAWHIRELSRYLSPLGWHVTDLKDPAHLERNYLVDSKGKFIGIVGCFEHLATATNKQLEMHAEVPRVKNKISW